MIDDLKCHGIGCLIESLTNSHFLLNFTEDITDDEASPVSPINFARLVNFRFTNK